MVFTGSYLASADSAMGLPHKIPDGMRAISVKTTDVNDLGGFLYPGVRVDVLLAVKGAEKTSSRSLVLVQNVTVLATGKQLTPDPSGKPTEASIVTVLVTPDQAQRIVLAEEGGTIYFSLRNGGDNDMTEQKPTLFSEISGVPSAPPPAPVVKHKTLASGAPFPPTGTSVVTVLGSQSYTQMFRGNLPVNPSQYAPLAPRSESQNTPGAQR
jgi:pilus assembly protein CpaB